MKYPKKNMPTFHVTMSCNLNFFSFKAFLTKCTEATDVPLENETYFYKFSQFMNISPPYLIPMALNEYVVFYALSFRLKFLFLT